VTIGLSVTKQGERISIDHLRNDGSSNQHPGGLGNDFEGGESTPDIWILWLLGRVRRCRLAGQMKDETLFHNTRFRKYLYLVSLGYESYMCNVYPITHLSRVLRTARNWDFVTREAS